MWSNDYPLKFHMAELARASIVIWVIWRRRSDKLLNSNVRKLYNESTRVMLRRLKVAN
jgi:hypothetical protein